MGGTLINLLCKGPFTSSMSGLDRGTPLCQDWMGYPPVRTGYGYSPVKTGWGYPLPLGLDWGNPPPPSGLDGGSPHQEIGRQSSYAAGGMPLAFKHEDFLVPKVVQGQRCSMCCEFPIYFHSLFHNWSKLFLEYSKITWLEKTNPIPPGFSRFPVRSLNHFGQQSSCYLALIMLWCECVCSQPQITDSAKTFGEI